MTTAHGPLVGASHVGRNKPRRHPVSACSLTFTPARLYSCFVGVSVVITVYNLEAYVEECLDSVAAQDIEDLQIIVVDDASTDRSLEVIRAWEQDHAGEIEIIAQEVNQGVSRTCNDGLRACIYDYLSLLDGDDVLEPGILSAHCAMLDEAPSSVAVVYGNTRLFTADSSLLPGLALDGITPFEGDIFIPLVENGSVIPVIGTVMRRAVVDALGGLDEAYSYQDWPLWLKIAREHQFRFSHQIAGRYRQHAMSMSHARSADLRRARIEILSDLLDQSPTPTVRRAIKARSVRVARDIWSARDGSDARRSCRQLLRKTRDPRLALIVAGMSLRLPHRQLRRLAYWSRPGSWRTRWRRQRMPERTSASR